MWLGVPARYAEVDLGLLKHREELDSYCELVGSREHRGQGLLLWGPKGTGKSRALGWITGRAWAWRNCHPAAWKPGEPTDGTLGLRFQSAGDLVQDLYANNDGPYEACRKTELLLLDEMGGTYEHEWMLTRITELVEHRYQHMRPTVYASNAAPGELAARPGWERMADRLKETCEILEFGGDSMRQPPGGA